MSEYALKLKDISVGTTQKWRCFAQKINQTYLALQEERVASTLNVLSIYKVDTNGQLTSADSVTSPLSGQYATVNRSMAINSDGTKIATLKQTSTSGYVAIHDWDEGTETITVEDALPTSVNQGSSAIVYGATQDKFYLFYVKTANLYYREIYETATPGTWAVGSEQTLDTTIYTSDFYITEIDDDRVFISFANTSAEMQCAIIELDAAPNIGTIYDINIVDTNTGSKAIYDSGNNAVIVVYKSGTAVKVMPVDIGAGTVCTPNTGQEVTLTEIYTGNATWFLAYNSGIEDKVFVTGKAISDGTGQGVIITLNYDGSTLTQETIYHSSASGKTAQGTGTYTCGIIQDVSNDYYLIYEYVNSEDNTEYGAIISYEIALLSGTYQGTPLIGFLT